MTNDYLYSNILLLEERGVGVYKYKDVIEQIYNSCEITSMKIFNDYLINWNNKPTKFYIEKRLTDKIDFIKNLKILVIPRLVSSYEEGEHGKYKAENCMLQDNKLSNIEIVLELQINDKCGEIYGHIFYNTLYHELNHAYQMYQSMLNDNINNSKYSQPSTVEHIKDLTEDELIKNVFLNNGIAANAKAAYFAYLFYCIFDKFEYNAKIAGLYGELKGLYNDGVSFPEILHQTEAYKIYRALYDDIDSVFRTVSDEEFERLMSLLQSYGVKREWKTKYSFLRRMKYWLELFMKKIGKTASLYYDEITDRRKIDESAHYINYSVPNDWGKRIREMLKINSNEC